jgi:hypothetical protein
VRVLAVAHLLDLAQLDRQHFRVLAAAVALVERIQVVRDSRRRSAPCARNTFFASAKRSVSETLPALRSLASTWP